MRTVKKKLCFCLYSPAKVLKMRFTEEEIRKHRELLENERA